MIKTIISLFAIYNSASSNSRMLHQWAPPSQGVGVNPGAGTVNPGQGQPQFVPNPVNPGPVNPGPATVTPPVTPPVNPGGVATPPINSNPGIGGGAPVTNPGVGAPNPAIPNPGGVVPGGAPWEPATGGAAPGAGAGAPGVWIPPVIPSLQAAQQATVMECNLPNTAVAGCAGRMTKVTNPGRNYKMTCANIGACASSDIVFDFQNSFVERVEMMSFSEMYAGYNANVRIDSTASARKQYIDKFECKAYGACQGTAIELFGGASLNDVDCPYPNYCQGCTISVCEWGPINPMTGLPSKLCGTPKPCFGY